MADETITVRRDENRNENGGETVTVRREGVPVAGETVTVRRGDTSATGEEVAVHCPAAMPGEETLTVPRPKPSAASGETVTVTRPVQAGAYSDTVTVARNSYQGDGQTATVPRCNTDNGQTVTVARDAPTSSNGETVTVLRGNTETPVSLMSPFVPEDVIIASNDGQRFIVHLGRVIGHGGQSVVVAAERVDDGLACVAKVFKPLVDAERSAYQKVVSAVMGLNDRPVSQTHLLPIFAYLHQGLSATELGAVAPQLWDVSITPMATCLYDRPRSTHMVKSRVIPELSQAIELLHTELGIVHRDIKPQNVYLYDKQIVLGDYGSARSLSGFDNRQTNTMTRSDGYTPGRGGMVDPRNDWYSFGYTVWTLYDGNVHPLQEFMNDNTLFDRLETGEPADFNHPDDATLGNLLQGLTFELSGERFGYEEVKDWIADPEHFYRKLPTMDAGSARKPYKFAGKSYSDPVLLARALSSNWDEAKLRMSQQQLENLMAEWGENDLQTKIHQLVEEDIQTASNPDLALACVIYEMSGKKIMSWRGEDVAPSDGPDALPARIAKMSNADIDRYAMRSGLDGTASSGVLPSGFLSRILSREEGVDEERTKLVADIHELERLAQNSDNPHFAACLFKGLLIRDSKKRDAAQTAIMSLIGHPQSFFKMCSSTRTLDEFLLHFAGVSEMTMIISARDAATRDGSIDIDVVLDFMDKVAINKKAVRTFYRKFGSYAPWLWLAGHMDLYSSASGSNGEMVRIAFLGLNPPKDASVSQLIQAGTGARNEALKLQGDMEQTPVPYVNGWETDSKRGTIPRTKEALFCAQVGDDLVPRGYVVDLINDGVDSQLLAEREIKLLADGKRMTSAEYSEFLEDTCGVADGALRSAIEQDTRDYGVVEGIADSDARTAAVKKEQRGVLVSTVLVALLYLIVIMCSRNAFGQLIVSFGSFGPIAAVFLVVAFVACFGFLALNLLRSFSAADRVGSLKNDLDANTAAFENYLLQLAEFDDRKGKVFDALTSVSGDMALPEAKALAFSSGRAPDTFYTDPHVMDRFGRYAGRLVLLASLLTSAFGFMGPMFIDGDTFTKIDIVIAVLIGAMAVAVIFGDDAHPGSAKSIRTWLYAWIFPIVIEFFLWGVVAVAQLLSVVGLILMMIGFGICAFVFYAFYSGQRGDGIF